MNMKHRNIIFIFIIGIVFARAGVCLADTEKKTFEIHYRIADGYNSILNPSFVSENTLPITLQNPRREGYTFGGWYRDDGFEERIYEITECREQTLYAKWNLNINANQNVQDYPYRRSGENMILKEISYGFLHALDTPGNPETRVDDLLENKFSSEYQCPQGLCITPEYYIVSSYSMESDKLGALSLYDRKTGAYVVSFGMEAKSHLGGVAFDGKNLWICHSNTKEIECISYDFIKRIAKVSNQNFIDITECFTKYKVNNIPSCIACKDGKIYVATHRVYALGVLYCYEFIDNSLKLKEKILIPPKVQGIFFDEQNQIWISQSYGRNKSSYLLFYESYARLKSEVLKATATLEMPPGSEAVVVDNGIVYVLFETASYKYYEGSDGRGTCKYPIDKILMINGDSLRYD